jgi:hypothetical protein
MAHQARADVAHDALADERVVVALVDADHARTERRERHADHVDDDAAFGMLRDRVVDDPLREQRRQQTEERADQDTAQHHADLFPVGPKERADATPISLALGFRLLGVVHRRPHHMRRTAT